MAGRHFFNRSYSSGLIDRCTSDNAFDTIDRITGMRRFLQSSSESFIEFTEFRMIERIKNFKSAPE